MAGCALFALSSCHSLDDENSYKYGITIPMVYSMVDTETPDQTVEYYKSNASCEYNMFTNTEGEIVIDELRLPNGTHLTKASIENTATGMATSKFGIFFMPTDNTVYGNFGSTNPENFNAYFGGVDLRVASMNFKLGNTSVFGFSASVPLFSNTTVFDNDPDNPASPFKTEEQNLNLYVISLKLDGGNLAADVTMQAAKFATNMNKEVNFRIKNLTARMIPNSRQLVVAMPDGVESINPVVLSNNVEGEPMPRYAISNLYCVLSLQGNASPGIIRYDVGGRYRVESTLLEFIETKTDDGSGATGSN